MVAGWLIAGRALEPMRRITRSARRVSQESLDERIALTGPEDELRELARTFDDMLDRLENPSTPGAGSSRTRATSCAAR